MGKSDFRREIHDFEGWKRLLLEEIDGGHWIMQGQIGRLSRNCNIVSVMGKGLGVFTYVTLRYAIVISHRG